MQQANYQCTKAQFDADDVLANSSHLKLAQQNLTQHCPSQMQTQVPQSTIQMNLEQTIFAQNSIFQSSTSNLNLLNDSNSQVIRCVPPNFLQKKQNLLISQSVSAQSSSSLAQRKENNDLADPLSLFDTLSQE